MLRVAIQMDPVEAVNIESDTTWLMMTTAQDRGYAQWVYDVRTLALEDGRLFCRARPVTLRRNAGDHVSFDKEVKLDLSQDVDVILMRQDPPFDMAYVTATYLLYEMLHFSYHLPRDHWLHRHVPGLWRLRHLHVLHHQREHMTEINFNLTFPLTDWLLGTLRWQPERQDKASGPPAG